MLFASLPFLLGFLPLVLASSYLISRALGPQAVLVFLIAASLVFYGWHTPMHVALLLSSIAVNLVLGRQIATSGSKVILTIGVVFNLGLLAWFKYAGFLAVNFEALTGISPGLGQIALPLGISFFTFQQIAYLVDIYRRETVPSHTLDYGFFVAFFPQLIAGPIVHHRVLMPQLKDVAFARFRAEDVLAGLELFSIGLAKKVLLADNLGVTADRLFEVQAAGVPLSTPEAWIGMLAYSFQIYFDFSGYSDMALGLGRMFGLRLPINFASPYKSASIVEFWRRWNITLSHFLRDYLYFALGGSRRGVVWRYANLWIVMLLGGLWHGASWTFMVWGGLHGLYLCLCHGWRAAGMSPLPKVLGVALTFVAALMAWVFFRAVNFEQAFEILGTLWGLAGSGDWQVQVFHEQPLALWLIGLAGAVAFWAPNSMELLARLEETRGQSWRSAVVAALAGFALFNLYAAGSHAFIYFQF